MDTRDYRLGYRGDIEGLRAVAILLVVAAHAKVSWLAGGFVGVDVFFVLSGYLITGLLLQEIDRIDHVRFANFYARRFRRLLPALLVMLVCTSVVAAVVLAPNQQDMQAIAAATASLWLSNLHFAFSRLDYFSPDAASNLYLHTWSLGVEEQFYLVWPTLVAWAWGVFRGKGGPARRLKIVMLVIAGTSLAACVALTRSAPQMAFYLMPLRAWQFAAGALTWLYFDPSRHVGASEDGNARHGPVSIDRWLGWLGLALIVAASLWFDANMAYPGWRAMLPTAGAVAVIVAGMRGAGGGVSRVLSWRLLQALGRVSYSWYLWHWPVLLLGASFIATDSAGYRAALVALSLLLAMCSYRWIESPIRHQARWVVRPGVTVLSALALMVVASLLCINWGDAAGRWSNSPAQQRYMQAHVDGPVIYLMGCDDWYHSDRVHACAFGPANATHTAVLMGDSIGAQWFPAVLGIFHRPDWRLLVLTKSSCPMVDEPIFYARIGRDYVECTTWRRHALLQVAALRPDIVILGSVQTYNFDQPQWVEGTSRLLKTISGASGHIYLLRSTPHLPFDGPDCLSSRNWLSTVLHVQPTPCRASVYSKQGNDVYQWLQQASERFANVTVLDLNNAICPNGECEAQRGGMVVFRDSRHMTATFAKSLGADLGQLLELQQPESRDRQNN